MLDLPPPQGSMLGTMSDAVFRMVQRMLAAVQSLPGSAIFSPTKVELRFVCLRHSRP